MLSVFFSETPVTDFASARASQTWRFSRRSSMPCSTAGVYPPCSAYEAWFRFLLRLTTTHSSGSPTPYLRPHRPPPQEDKP